jgi:hypothetical protein
VAAGGAVCVCVVDEEEPPERPCHREPGRSLKRELLGHLDVARDACYSWSWHSGASLGQMPGVRRGPAKQFEVTGGRGVK